MFRDLKGKKLLILGGTRISCEIVRYAKKMGVYTVVTDYYPPENSPAKQIADEHFLVSTTDVDAVVELIKAKQIEGVMVGFSDMLLPYYAEICDKAGLPAYGTKEQFEAFINKERYKALCREHKVPTVDEYVVRVDHFEQDTANILFPVLVKPADSSGARGITICQNAEELQEAIEKAQGFSKTGVVLVERYLTGKEATVFWVFQNGKYHLCGIGNRHVKHNQEGVIPLPVGYTFPAMVTEDYINNIEPKVKEMFASVGIKNGMMFMQCKIENGECVVYDVGYRLTGSLEYKIFEEVCGYNPMKMLIHFALTGEMADVDISEYVNPYIGKYAYNVSFLGKPGKIAQITGNDTVLDIPGVIDSVLAHYPGEEITQNMRGLLAQICLRVLGTAEDKDDLWNKIEKVQNSVHIISTMGEEMMLPGFEFSDIVNVVKNIDEV